MYIHLCNIYIYIYTCVDVCVCMYVYIYIYRERERDIHEARAEVREEDLQSFRRRGPGRLIVLCVCCDDLMYTCKYISLYIHIKYMCKCLYIYIYRDI